MSYSPLTQAQLSLDLDRVIEDLRDLRDAVGQGVPGEGNPATLQEYAQWVRQVRGVLGVSIAKLGGVSSILQEYEPT